VHEPLCWDHTLKPQNVGRERMLKSPLREALVQAPVLSTLRRTLMPRLLTESLKSLWKVGIDPPSVPAGLCDRLRELFDRDLTRLGSRLGVELDCDSFHEVAGAQALSWRQFDHDPCCSSAFYRRVADAAGPPLLLPRGAGGTPLAGSGRNGRMRAICRPRRASHPLIRPCGAPSPAGEGMRATAFLDRWMQRASKPRSRGPATSLLTRLCVLPLLAGVDCAGDATVQGIDGGLETREQAAV